MMPLMHAWCSRNVVNSCYVPCAWLYWTCSTKITINAEIFISAPLAHPRDFNMQFPASFHDFTRPVPVSDRRITSPVHSGYKGRHGVMRSAQGAFRLIKTSSAALGWPENGDCYIMHTKNVVILLALLYKWHRSVITMVAPYSGLYTIYYFSASQPFVLNCLKKLASKTSLTTAWNTTIGLT